MTKKGQSFTWSAYTEDESRYCTWKTVGRIVCISKAEVVSITEVKKNEPPEGLGYSLPGEESLEKEESDFEDLQTDSEMVKGSDDHDSDESTLKDRKEAFRKAVEKDYKKRYYPSKYYDRR